MRESRINPSNIIGVGGGIVGAGFGAIISRDNPAEGWVVGYVVGSGLLRCSSDSPFGWYFFRPVEKEARMGGGDGTKDNEYVVTVTKAINHTIISTSCIIGGALSGGIPMAKAAMDQVYASGNNNFIAISASIAGFAAGAAIGGLCGTVLSFPLRWATLGIVSAPIAAVDAVRITGRLLSGKRPFSGQSWSTPQLG